MPWEKRYIALDMLERWVILARYKTFTRIQPGPFTRSRKGMRAWHSRGMTSRRHWFVSPWIPSARDAPRSVTFKRNRPPILMEARVWKVRERERERKVKHSLKHFFRMDNSLFMFSNFFFHSMKEERNSIPAGEQREQRVIVKASK